MPAAHHTLLHDFSCTSLLHALLSWPASDLALCLVSSEHVSQKALKKPKKKKLTPAEKKEKMKMLHRKVFYALARLIVLCCFSCCNC